MATFLQSTQQISAGEERKLICVWIDKLCFPESRYEALRELSVRRDYPDLGLMLWHAFGAVAALLQEITALYNTLLSKTLNWLGSNRACYAMTLFQAIAAHPEARIPFVRSEAMMFLMPILHATEQTLPVEYLRLSVLGIVGDLVKTPSNEVVSFLLGPICIMPHVLRFLELGSEMSKAITAFILWRILEHDVGLKHLTTNKLACFHLIYTLAKVVHQLTLEPDPRILKSIVGSYKRLTYDKYAQGLLQEHLPQQLRNDCFCYEPSAGYEGIIDDLKELNRRVNGLFPIQNANNLTVQKRWN